MTIRKAAGLNVVAVGLIPERQQAEEIVAGERRISSLWLAARSTIRDGLGTQRLRRERQ
jgi:hypothetical protein